MAAQTQTEIGQLGTGASRAVAFGGGGEWFIAWMLGYAHGLRDAGIDLAQADVAIGTSAGSVVGAAIKAGKLDALTTAFTELGANPQKAATSLPIPLGSPSQERAHRVMSSTTEVTTETLQEIGRAAMAAHNGPPADYIAFLNSLLGLDSWPAGQFTTATDCYTAEPLIVGPDSGIDIATACAASSSLPGDMGPTWLGDRLVMDGGVSHSSMHAPMLSGATFVLILGMLDFKTNPPKKVNPAFGLSERTAPGTAEREAQALRDAGSTVHVAIANPDPDTDFMDPATIPAALSAGRERGAADAPLIAPHWAATPAPH
ncbi:MAG: patatin-like phospholipase family protein [Candidatus Nanopelagicales bacterium]